MEELDVIPIHSDDGIIPNVNVNPRVFVRKRGGDYEEILDIKSFERNGDNLSGGLVSFAMEEVSNGTIHKLLRKLLSEYVDVKMEFMLGMLMVMSFSGFVEEVSSNKIVFSVSTPMTTDVQDVSH